jgi:hypothetical protein
MRLFGQRWRDVDLDQTIAVGDVFSEGEGRRVNARRGMV